MNRRSVLFIIAAIGCSISFADLDSLQYLGILESSENHGVIDYSVRAAFKKIKSRWTPIVNSEELSDSILLQYPQESRWQVLFNGEYIGTIRARRPAKYSYYSEVGKLIPDSPGVMPHVGNINLKFSGWMNDSGYRPLVVNSKKFSKDPEHWRPFKINDEIVREAWKEFIKVNKGLENCNDEYSDSYKIDNDGEKLKKIVKAYKSNSGSILINIGPDPSQYKCDGGTDDWTQRTFYVDENNSMHYIGVGIDLIDAGDYDGDGHSEFVFKYRGYNLDGYEIFYDDFNSKAEFKWSYH